MVDRARVLLFRRGLLPGLQGSGLARKPLLMHALQVLLSALGVGSLVWAFSDARFRGADDFLAGGFIVPSSIGIALLLLGWSATRPWRVAACWFSLALVGRAVSLQLIDAGPRLHYQHYLPFDRLFTETHPFFPAFLALQTALVLAGLSLRAGKIWRWLRSNFKAWQLAGIGLVFILPAAAVSPQLTRFLSEMAFAFLIQAVHLGTIVLMALSIPKRAHTWWSKWSHQLLGPRSEEDSPQPCRPGRLVIIAAIWVAVLAAGLNFFAYERHPHVTDEVVYLLQARYFAEGRLSTPLPPVPEAFEIYLMQTQQERWYPTPPPGWPAMLSLGVLLQVPWLVNPLLAGVNVLLGYSLISVLYSQRTARIAVLLLAVSPWYIFLGMSFMTHMFTLTCALAAALGIAWSRRTDQARWAWFGGLALGVMALIRPLEALVMAGLLGLWAVGIGGRRLRISAITGLLVTSIAVGTAVLPYNQALTGNPMLFPIMAYTNEHFGPNSNALGFGPDRGMGWELDPYPGHSPRDALINSNLNTFSLNIDLFGWGTGSLLLATVAVLGRRLRRSDYLMIAVIAFVWVAHFFYYFSGGPDFGARYWFLMVIPAVALTARGIHLLEGLWGGDPTGGGAPAVLVTLVVVALSAMTLVNYVPWRAVDKYHDFRGMQPDIRTLAEKHDFGRSIVLVRGEARPDYASAAIYNPVDLQEEAPIYAWERDENLRSRVLAAYPDRQVWVVEGPSVTQAGYQVVSGPVPAAELRSRGGRGR